MPKKMLDTQFNWIKYNEPESHLDNLVSKLISKNKKTDIKILGISYKDESTLERFKKENYISINYLNLSKYNIKNKLEINEIVDEINTKNVIEIEKNIKYDLIIARHILEHSRNPNQFIEALQILCAKDGYIVIEIPSAELMIAKKEYSLIWEEHQIYFTNKSLKNYFKNKKIEIDEIITYEYPLENSIICIIKNKKIEAPKIDQKNGKKLEVWDEFIKEKENIKAKMDMWIKDNYKIIMIGAGHIAMRFINIYEIANKIEFIIDDDINKTKYLAPRSRKKILKNYVINSEERNIYIHALSPESEVKFKDKHEINNEKIKMFSIFKNHKKSIYYV
jgi:hypothetical protein